MSDGYDGGTLDLRGMFETPPRPSHLIWFGAGKHLSLDRAGLASMPAPPFPTVPHRNEIMMRPVNKRPMTRTRSESH